MKQFEMKSSIGITITKRFNEVTAPEWLKYGGRKGSTMDNRWFWEDHIMKLEVGESIQTDFNIITRIYDE